MLKRAHQTTHCHDCKHLLRHPDHPETLFACVVKRMQTEDGTPGGEGYYHIKVANLTPDCKHFKARGEKWQPEWDAEDPDALDLLDLIDSMPWDAVDCSDTTTDDLLFEVDESTPYYPVEDLPSDTTGQVIWSDTTSTDPECIVASRNRKARALRKAQEASDTTWTCPYCGESFPAVNIRGETRKGCPNSRCAGKQQAAASHAKGTHIKYKYDDEVLTVVTTAYIPGVFGYRQIATLTGIPVSSIKNLIKRASKRSKDHE